MQPEDFNLVLTGNDPNPATFSESGFGAEVLVDAGVYHRRMHFDWSSRG